MYHLQKQTIESKEIVLNGSEHNYLGPDLVLRNCSIVLRTPARALSLNSVQLIDCHIDAKKKLTNFQLWCGCVIRGCTFSGKYSGNDFGHWDSQGEGGEIADCDFSKAILDGCRFMECDIESIEFPKWPCFTILDPSQKKLEYESVHWPGQLDLWAEVLVESPECTSALTSHAPTLAKKLKASEKEIALALKYLTHVIK